MHRGFRVLGIASPRIRAGLLCASVFCLAGSFATATDPGRISKGDVVFISTDGTEFYVDRKVATTLPKNLELKVVDIESVWIGVSTFVDGVQSSGWIHSRKVFKKDVPAAVEALKKFKIKIEPDYLGNVNRIDANDSDLTGDALANIAKLYNLEGLELSGTKIGDDDLAHLQGLTNLQWLYLDNTSVTDKGLEHLTGLTNLDVLALNKTKVTGPGLVHLKPLKKLRALNLSECKFDDDAMEHIKGLTQIQTLAMQAVPIKGSGLKHLTGMPRLNVLNLNKTKLESGSLVHLKGSTELRILHLEDAEVDEADEKELDKAIPSLAIFH